MKQYDVTVRREDNLWSAVADGLPRGVVGSMDYDTFAELHAELPWFIADLTDTEPGDFAINWHYEINGRDVTEALRSLADATAELQRVHASQEQARKSALAALADAGLSQRAMAEILGISHQRVNQLVNS
jgi:hypothetical protein